MLIRKLTSQFALWFGLFSGVWMANPLLAQTAPSVGSFERTDLFTAGEGGFQTFRIPSVAITPKGTILVACAGRYNGAGDWSDIDTMLRRSIDNGKTWEPTRDLTDDGKNTVDNATFIIDGNRIFLMYQINYVKAYFKTSDDEGVTWSDPREITPVFETYRTRDNYDWKVIAMGPGHGIVLKSGRFIVPIWMATDHSHRPSITSTIYSDDHGQTWQAGDVVTPNKPESKNPSENVCIELSDGRVMNNIRCESPTLRRLVAYSPDGATHWTTPAVDSQLFDPICFASMARFPVATDGGKNRMLFCNPDSEGRMQLNNKAHGYVRENMTVRLSYDEGKTWPISKVFEPEEGGYSDLAVAPDGSVFIAYERAGAPAGKSFSTKSLSIAHFDLAWLTEGSDLGH